MKKQSRFSHCKKDHYRKTFLPSANALYDDEVMTSVQGEEILWKVNNKLLLWLFLWMGKKECPVCLRLQLLIEKLHSSPWILSSWSIAEWSLRCDQKIHKQIDKHTVLHNSLKASGCSVSAEVQYVHTKITSCTKKSKGDKQSQPCTCTYE